MSNAVFPSILGLSWDVKKTPTFASKVQSAVSGKELRLAYMSTPLWQYTLSYETLRSDARADFQTLLGFFLARQGMFDSFLFTDPHDNAVAAQLFGLGDGATAAFQLLKTYSGYSEPVQNVNSAPQIFVNDWEGNQLQFAVPRTNLALQSNDLTNASWVKVTATVAKDQLGPDSVVNGASSFLATGANATVLQSVTLASAQETYDVWLKRLTGVGNVQLTLDNGVGWTTMPVTGAWTKFTITQTLANPVIGIRLATNTDKVAVAYNQLEAGAVATSSIATTTVAVTVTDYALSSTGIVTFAVLPLIGAILTWTGSYYARCRFMQDLSEFNEFANNFWELKQLQFQSVKL